MNNKKITIALVGTTNVGKSTLFNRLIGQRKSIIDENPHITRDRVYGITNWKEQEFIVIDTGGIEQKNEESFQKQIKTQVEIAILEADYIFWIVNNQINPTNDDLYIFSILNKQKKPILILANKIENTNYQINYEYHKFNYEILGISALHNIGIADVLEKVKQTIKIEKKDVKNNNSFKIAIIGKTNVGKSSLLNSLTNSNRSIVSNIPNTTRDSISQVLKIENKEFELIDTAGLNKKTKLLLSVEHYALLRAKKTLEEANLTLIVMDVNQKLSHYDLRIIGYALENRKPIILIFNKIDLLEKFDKEKLTKEIEKQLSFVNWAPIIFVSVLKNKNIEKIKTTILDVYNNLNYEFSQNELNNFLLNIQIIHKPKSYKGGILQLRSIKQLKKNIPTFIVEVNNINFLHFSYKRFIENKLRISPHFRGCPINLIFKQNAKE